jgi:hypothetical protein
MIFASLAVLPDELLNLAQAAQRVGFGSPVIELPGQGQRLSVVFAGLDVLPHEPLNVAKSPQGVDLATPITKVAVDGEGLAMQIPDIGPEAEATEMHSQRRGRFAPPRRVKWILDRGLAFVLRWGTALRAPSSTGGLRWRRWTAVVSNSATTGLSRLYFEAIQPVQSPGPPPCAIELIARTHPSRLCRSTGVARDMGPKQPVGLMDDRQVPAGQAIHRRRPLGWRLFGIGAFTGVKARTKSCLPRRIKSVTSFSMSWRPCRPSRTRRSRCCSRCALPADLRAMVHLALLPNFVHHDPDVP